MSNDKQTAVEALAEAWASIDGKASRFEEERNGIVAADEFTGAYEGYMAEAEELIRRLAKRGYALAPSEAFEEVRADRLRQIDYACDLQRIIEDLCHGRDIREPKTSAVYHYNMAVAFRATLDGEGQQS